MFRFKSIPSTVLRNFILKPETPLSLTEAMGNKKCGASTKGPCQPENKPEIGGVKNDSCSKNKSQKCGRGTGSKRGGDCGKGGSASKGKKGKMCNKPKTPQPPPSKPSQSGGNNIIDKCGMFKSHKPNVKKWRLISYALVPLALGLSAFVLATKDEHPEPDYIPYEYMYRRTKRFAWRDGRTSLFHGANNLIPDQEEERIQRENKEQGQETVKYGKHINGEDKIKRREQRAREELERRNKRHEEERSTKDVEI